MKNLKLIRNNRGLTQNDMAKILNVSKPTYSHYETGKYEPDIKTIIKIADYFNCSVDFLLGHETHGILHIDRLTQIQQKLVAMIEVLNPDQTLKTLGFCSALLNLPFSDIKPNRPW